MMIKRVLCFIIISVALFAVVQSAGALPKEVAPVALKNPLAANSFAELIKAIANIILTIGATVAVIAIIYSGFLFVTARGNEQQVEKAKFTFQWTIIGTAVLLGATVIAEAIVNFIQSLK